MKLQGGLETLGVNYNTLLNRFSKNEELLEKFIKKFPADQTEEKLVESFNVLNYEEMYIAVHTLKGVAANLGFENLSQICDQMGSRLKKGDYSQVENDFEEVETEYYKVIKVIENLD